RFFAQVFDATPPKEHFVVKAASTARLCTRMSATKVSYGYPAPLRSPTQGFARTATRDGNRVHSRSPRPASCLRGICSDAQRNFVTRGASGQPSRIEAE